MVASRQIGAADGAAEKAVAREDCPLLMLDQNDVSGRVAGAVPKLEFQIADFQNLSVLDESGRLGRVVVIHSERHELVRFDSHRERLQAQRSIKRLLIAMKQNLRVRKSFMQEGSPADVIKMSMRDADRNQIQFVIRNVVRDRP